MEFEKRKRDNNCKCDSILNSQFSVECKCSEWFLLFFITFVRSIFFLLFFLFYFGPIRKFNVMTKSTKSNEKFSYFLNGSKLEVGQSSAISNQSTVLQHDLFKKKIINLWIVNFSAADFVLLNRF